MKKISLLAVISSLLVGGMTSQISAQDSCGSNWSDCCNSSFSDGKFKVGAEWLYWKAEQDDMALGITIAGTTEKTSAANTVDSCFVEPNFKYTNGFRVNLGYELPCNCWEANVIYTYLPTSASTKLITAVNANRAVDGPYLFIQPNPTFQILSIMNDRLGNPLVLPTDPFFQSYTQGWDLTINQIDFDVARTIVFNDCISIKPHAGFRAMWYTDSQRATFTGNSGNGQIGSTSATFVSDVSLKDKFTGYGIEAGLWGNWQLGAGLSVVGHFGGSILYAKYIVDESVLTTVTSTDSQAVVTVNEYTDTFCNTVHTATPSVDYFLGLQYADEMCDMSFAIRAGWEQHVYFDTNKIFQAGNLSTQGLTLGLEVGF